MVKLTIKTYHHVEISKQRYTESRNDKYRY